MLVKMDKDAIVTAYRVLDEYADRDGKLRLLVGSNGLWLIHPSKGMDSPLFLGRAEEV